MKLRVIATLVAVLALSAGSAFAQPSIGVFADAGSASCNITAPLYAPTNFYVNVIGTGSLSPSGFAGAEFRLDTGFAVGVDAALTPTANPAANLVLGNLFSGVNIAFPSCQVGPSVTLYTVSMIALNANVDNAYMTILPHNVPTNPNYPCALVNQCDAPAFTQFCVPGGSALVNGSGDPCQVAVEEATWSKVKNLFN